MFCTFLFSSDDTIIFRHATMNSRFQHLCLTRRPGFHHRQELVCNFYIVKTSNCTCNVQSDNVARLIWLCLITQFVHQFCTRLFSILRTIQYGFQVTFCIRRKPARPARSSAAEWHPYVHLVQRGHHVVERKRWHPSWSIEQCFVDASRSSFLQPSSTNFAATVSTAGPSVATITFIRDK